MKQQEYIRFSITSDYGSITRKDVFPDLLKVLMAYAHKLIGSGNLRLTRNRDELAYDFAMDAIKRYLENPEKFDQSRNNDLVNYLKFNLVRRLVSNYIDSASQKNEIGYETDDSTGIKVSNFSIFEQNIHEPIDGKDVLLKIAKELDGNTVLSQLFELKYKQECTRKEVCSELGISTGEYANRKRRLDTIINRVLKQLK